MAEDLLDDLTPAQREAVTHLDGPLLILAAAGSGKTRVITRRVAYLLQQGIRPGNILAITFTNKAAGEMRQRVEALVPGSRVWMSTFHSFGARILRQYGDRLGLDRNFTIYDQNDRARLVKQAVEEVEVGNARFTPDSLAGGISKAKNQLLSPERYAARARDHFARTVAKVYPAYERRLRAANALDFDDLLYWPALAMKNDPELRAELDARFRYVLIDEYQDTNHAQYQIARLLSVDHPNLCVVGDPDQSIYKFRGSDIRNILDFERDFPNTQVLTLSLNYRSTKAILHAAGELIAHNKQRKHKDLLTDNPAGRPVTVLTFPSSVEEAEGIARRIRRVVKEKKRSYRDFAIFLRINALSRGLEAAFIKERVPFQIVRGLAFFDRKENRDILAYLRLIVNPRDDLSFLRIVNEPARGIGKTSLQHLQNSAEANECSLLSAAGQVQRIASIKGKATAGLSDFYQMMTELGQLADLAPDGVIRQVLDRTGYRRMLQDSRDPEDQERLANIEELITAAKQFAEEDPERSLGDFLENITLASDVDSWDQKQDCVSVMTLHASKGLEFPVVYMVAVEQGLLPHERSLGKNEELEEERRLAFVGMTRAKEELYLCHARLREFRGNTLYAVPSMFLNELPEESMAQEEMDLPTRHDKAKDAWRGGGNAAAEGWEEAGIKPKKKSSRQAISKIPTHIPGMPESTGAGNTYRTGMLVKHPTYGPGQITEVSGHGVLRKVKIRFQRAGERSFIADKVKLEIVG
jgi:DNA helicase-2/ATP-dependent DNA helicase PcrA